MRSERKNQYDSIYNRDGRRLGGQKTVGKTLPPKTGPKTPFTADAAANQIARQRLGSLAADHEGESITAMKMMSLFDGSGGFPLAAAICEIEPVYASEVEPYPIAVTRSRFPNMVHIGDVSKVHGWDLDPVDVITFGSPCQDMSIAGKRAGIKNISAGDEETTRSGLFLEAIRIIREMRGATNGRYPAFAVWENVPGAFSSNKGEDFRIVLQELVGLVEPEAVVPEVPKGGWNYFDLWAGAGWSLAYRTFDAQYWGVPQRRRRIYLVLDLRGQRAGKVLFEPESLRGYPAPRREARKGTSANAERCIDVYDNNCLTPWDNQARRIYSADGIFPTLSSREKAGQNGQAVAIPINMMIATRHNALGERTGLGIGNIGDPQFTISAAHEHAVCIKIAAGFKAGQSSGGIGYQKECAATLSAQSSGTEPSVCICIQGNCIDQSDTAGCNGAGWKKDCCYTPNTIDRPAVAYTMQRFADYKENNVSSSLKARDNKGATDLIVGCVKYRYIVRRLTPTECARLQGFPDWWGYPNRKEDFTEDEYRFWLDVRNTHAIINGRSKKQYTKEQMLSWYNKLHTDSSEYKMWGNGIALPNALYVMMGIRKELEKEA